MDARNALGFEILTMEEVAQMLRMKPGTLRKRVKSGSAPPVTVIGGRKAFRSDVLADWLRRQTAPAPTLANEACA